MNKNLIVRCLLVLLSLCMVLCCFAACGEKESTGDEQGSTPETDGGADSEAGSEEEDEGPVENLPEIKYEKRPFVMYLRDNSEYISDQVVTEDDLAGLHSIVDSAVYERNAAVEERFGIVIDYVRSTSNNYDTSALNSIQSGSCDYDVIANHGRAMFNYATNLCLMDWNDLKWVDLSQPWWNQGMIKDFTLNNVLFCLSGDISWQSLGATVGMVFNKQVCDDLGMEYPYAAALDGTWTFAKFSEMVSQSNSNLDGEGEMDPLLGDQMGYITAYYRGPMTAVYSGGGMIVTPSEDGTSLVCDVYTQQNISLFEDFFELCEQDNCIIYKDSMLTNSDTAYLTLFAMGTTLFTDTRLYDISFLLSADMTTYGIVPWPKYNDAVPGTEYHSWVDAVGNTFGIPVTHKPDPEDPTDDRAEFISIVLEALAAEGYREVLPTFYEEILQSKYAQDPNAVDCLNLIRDGRRYDIATYMNSNLSIGNLGTDLVDYPDHNFSTYWNGKKQTTTTQLLQVNAIFDYITANK